MVGGLVGVPAPQCGPPAGLEGPSGRGGVPPPGWGLPRIIGGTNPLNRDWLGPGRTPGGLKV
jgi:hypothetical protein